MNESLQSSKFELARRIRGILTGNAVGSGLILLIVFTAGFANLAVEVIGARIVSGIYGSTNHVWACVIVSTLGGLSLGYFIGGLLGSQLKRYYLPSILVVAGLSLLVIKEISEVSAESLGGYSIGSILVTASAGLLLPSVLFGAIPPLAISYLNQLTDRHASKSVGIVGCLGTLGGILGGISAVLVGIPDFGIALSLQLLCGALVALASAAAAAPWIGLIIVIIAIYPRWIDRSSPNNNLIARVEGEYQTISVYESDSTESVMLMLGHACQSQFHKPTRSAIAPNARKMIEIAAAHKVTEALVIGGAGNSLALTLEGAGVKVESIELDPVVAQIAERYFGKTLGKTHIGDGRAIIRWGNISTKDLIVVDAFCAPGQIPPHMVTREFYGELRRLLRPDGLVIVNTAGVPADHFGGLAGAFYSTMASEFEFVRALPVRQQDIHSKEYQNILYLCTNGKPAAAGDKCKAWYGQIATDDHNPIERLMLSAQASHLTRLGTDEVARSFLDHLP